MEKRKIKVALAGNPNAGKSTAFNALTGARQHIANYPGVTVEKKVGWIRHKDYDIEIIDLPGIYSLTAYSIEELVARDYLINERPDVVIDIVDASNLDRNLYLTIQFKELGAPLVVALNMVDVAEARGILIDQEVLSSLLGVEVVPTVARSNRGLSMVLEKAVETALAEQKWHPSLISYGRDIDESLNALEKVIDGSLTYNSRYSPKWLALKCLEGDSQIRDFIQSDPLASKEIYAVCAKTSKHIQSTLEEDPEGIIADHRYGYIAGITKKALKRKIESRLNLSDRIDKVLTNRILGPVIMMAVLYAVYEFTFWASDEPVRWFETFFSWMGGILTNAIPEGHLRSLVVSGIVDGVGGVLGFVPLIMFMFFVIAILEDSGYLARMAYMLDRVLRWFGLHGNSVLPLLISGGISGGCAVPGVMAARTLRDPKERIATLLVVPFMNCGAKLPVLALLIAAFFGRHEARMMFIFTLLSWAFALLSAKLIRATVLRGPKTPFVMELPPYRAPTAKGLLIHTWERTWQYIKKAGTIILGVSIILWAMMSFPGPSEEESRYFENRRAELRASFLSLPEVRDLIRDEADLEELNRLYDEYEEAVREGDSTAILESRKNSAFSILEDRKGGFGIEGDRTGAEAYGLYRKGIAQVNAEEQSAALQGTIAGRMGRFMENFTNPLGFDYRINISLIGGFVAKEVIISSLGTAFSLGDAEAGQEVSLSQRLKRDPGWNPLLAFTLIIFIMLYVPCFVTVISIARESSWRWAGFSILFNLTVAGIAALIVYQSGRLLGIGL